MILKNISSIKELTSIHTYPIPPITQLSFWLKANEGVNGGSPNDGDPVTNWDDQGPNGFNFTQSTFANQPTWRSNGSNGQPYLEFTNPTYLDLTADLFSGNECTIYIVLKRTSASSGGQFGTPLFLNATNFINAGTGFITFYAVDVFGGLPNGNWFANFNTAGLDTDYGAYDANTTLLANIKTNTGNEGRRNSANVTTGTGAQTLQNFYHTIGTWFNFGRTFEGEIYEIIAYDGVHNATEIAIVENYLTSKYTI